MKKELTKEILCAYLPHDAQCKLRGSRKKYSLNGIRWGKAVLAGRDGVTVYKPLHEVLIISRPLSDLTREITHNGETFVPVECFEIGDGENDSQEYDHGNTKLISTLKAMAEHELHEDATYLPYGVVQKLLSWHFDLFGLCEAGLAIDINTLTK